MVNSRYHDSRSHHQTYLQISIHSEINSRPPLIRILGPLVTNPALAEEDPNERGVVDTRPVSHGEGEGVGVVVWRIAEVQVAVHRELVRKKVLLS